MENKTCTECNETKSIDLYYNRTGGGVRNYCIACFSRIKTERVAAIRKWVADYKLERACKKCGYSKETHPEFSTYALEFHHTRDDKEFAVSLGTGRGYSLDRIKKEIAKCVILCSRCHAETHNR